MSRLRKVINKKQTDFLKDVVEKGRVTQAYLFCGPSGVGKWDLALEFVAEVNGKEDLNLIERGADPDVVIVKPEIDNKNGKVRKKDISITQIKDAIKKIGYYSYGSKYKFLIVKESDKMTTVAANSLLKLIEDSTPDTIVVLLSNNEMKTLSTIKSRCQIIRFGIATSKEIYDQLKEEGELIEDEFLDSVIFFSQGKISKARNFIKNREVLKESELNLDSFKGALKRGVVDGMNLSEDIYNDKEKLKVFLDESVWYLRNLLKEQVDGGADIRIIRKILFITEDVVELRSNISSSSTNQRLQLENFFVQL